MFLMAKNGNFSPLRILRSELDEGNSHDHGNNHKRIVYLIFLLKKIKFFVLSFRSSIVRTTPELAVAAVELFKSLSTFTDIFL
jgi:hypothetical protein